MSFEDWVITISDLLKALGWQLTLVVLLLGFGSEVRALLKAMRYRIETGAWTVKLGSLEVQAPEPVLKIPEPQERE